MQTKQDQNPGVNMKSYSSMPSTYDKLDSTNLKRCEQPHPCEIPGVCSLHDFSLWLTSFSHSLLLLSDIPYTWLLYFFRSLCTFCFHLHNFIYCPLRCTLPGLPGLLLTSGWKLHFHNLCIHHACKTSITWIPKYAPSSSHSRVPLWLQRPE